MTSQFDQRSLISLTSEIVSVYVANNPVPMTELAALIAGIHRSMAGLSAPTAPATEEVRRPAVSIKQSVQHDYIICLEDGLHFKSMKQHLGNKYGMTPAEYRVKWNLPADYPMVAPAFAARRSVLAKASGLGRQGRKTADPVKNARKKPPAK